MVKKLHEEYLPAIMEKFERRAKANNTKEGLDIWQQGKPRHNLESLHYPAPLFPSSSPTQT